MAPNPAIQIKYNPVTTELPPSIQENYPGADSMPGRGFWPQPSEHTSTTPTAQVPKGLIVGDFIFMLESAEFEGDSVAPHGYAVARVSTGMLDTTTFYPKPNGLVKVAAFDGRFLYMGGSFTAVDGVTQIDSRVIGGLCRFDFQDGGRLDTSWNPQPFHAILAAVDTLEVNPDKTTIYIAGNFTSLRAATRNFIGEADITAGGTGTISSWDANPSAEPTSVKYDSANTRVYLSGTFASIQGNSAHKRLVRMSTSGSGAVDATWLPDPNAACRVVFLDGARIFVGGEFTSIGETPATRNKAAEIDDAGEVTSWNPNVSIGGSDTVFAIEKTTDTTKLVSGSFKEFMLIAGLFTTVGGSGRESIAAVDTATGTLDPWDPDPGPPSGSSLQIFQMIARDRTVYVFGNYEGIANVGSTRKDIAAVPFPLFQDDNSKFFAKTGDDAAAGTRAAPFLTAGKALTSLGGGNVYAVGLDDGIYRENIDGTIPVDLGLWSEPGKTPTLTGEPGATTGTFGARPVGRTKFSTGAFPSTFVFLSKAGNDGTGTRGDQSKPFLSFTNAKTNMLDGDTMQIEDSGLYDTGAQTFGFATAITIQAAAGQTPTLRFQDSFPGGGIHFNGNNGVGQSLDIYGVIFQTGPDQEFPTVKTIRSEGPLNLFDCTFREGADTILALDAGAIANCLFSNVPGLAIEIQDTATVRNCSFLNCGGLSGGTKDATIYCTKDADDIIINQCTFENPGIGTATGSPWDAILIEKDNTSPDPATDLVSFCDFFYTDLSETKDVRGVHIDRLATSPTAGVSTRVSDCQFADLGRQAVYFNTAFNGDWSLGGDRCVAYRCQKLATAGEGIYQFEKPNLFTIKSYVAVESGTQGFQINKGDATPTGSRFDNCVAVNSAGAGFRVEANSIAPQLSTFQGCIEFGSTGNGFEITNDTQVGKEIVIYSSFQRPVVFGTSVLILTATFQNVDPGFINTGSGSENLAVFADSLTIFNGDPISSKNMGFFGAVLTLSNGGERVSGFIIDSALNKDNGINVDEGITNQGVVENCTFKRLGGYGVLLASNYKLENCLFQNQGTGVLMTGDAPEITRCVGDGCGSAFILAGGANLIIKNNTAYLCDFGQFDRVGAFFAELKNNIYFANGSADYEGNADITNSVVGTLEALATVTSGSRFDPLFRDTGTRDLRIQVTEDGFVFNSPAKDLGDNGKDAGAFEITRGTTVKVWTLVDFEKDLGGGKIYRNPTFLTRKVAPLKLREGETHGGVTYSDASSFKRERVLTWAADTDMPPEQVVDLEAIYSTGDGEVEISLDGGTLFIPSRIIRSAGFEFTELDEATYSDSSLPTPVRELVLRDSD